MTSTTHRTLADMILHRARTSPDGVALRAKRDGTYVDLRWSEATPRLEAIGAALLTAAKLDDGAAVAVIGNTSLDWVLADFAALCIGLKTVPIYASLLPEEVGYMHADTAAQLVIVEDGTQLEKVRAMRRGFSFFDKRYEPSSIALKGKVIVVDAKGIAPADDWETLADAEARGRAALSGPEGAQLRADMERRRSLLTRDTLATFTYTSGTTGPPKAVLQTGGNMLSLLESVERTRLIDEVGRAHGLFLFLPLAHSFGRFVELAGPFFGAPLVLSSVPTLADDLGKSRPGFFPAAPRVFEKMAAKIEAGVKSTPGAKGAIARWALGVGRSAIPYRSTGRGLPIWLRGSYALADRLVLSALRARLGLDRCSVALSGSAPLRTDVHELFLALGVTLVEAYGLTETCPGLTSNLPGKIRLGTVGPPFDCVQLRIAEDGEVLAKGGNITTGYLNRPDATADAFDKDGWFHTGDLGSLDDAGFLRITGRKKELLKTSGGKYIAPVKIEAKLKALSFVQEAMVVGDNRNFCTVLFALDPEMLAEFAKQNGVPAEPQHDKVRAALQAHVDEVNRSLASFESVKAFRVVPGPFTVAGGELTASLKVKRKAVLDKYGSLVEEMYKTAAADKNNNNKD